jgi:hypothetical protein
MSINPKADISLALAPDWHPLAWIDNYLLARGWTNDGAGWLPPERYRDEIAIVAGHGRFRRGLALHF